MTEDLSKIWREYRAEQHVKRGAIVVDLGSSEGYFAQVSALSSTGSMRVMEGLSAHTTDGAPSRVEGLGAYIVSDTGSTRMIGLPSILSK